MIRIARLVVALVLALVSIDAHAHEGGAHLKGTVERVDENRIVLRGTDGKTTELALTPATRFVRGATPVARTEVKNGERAVVHGKRSDARLEATLVKLAPAASKH